MFPYLTASYSCGASNPFSAHKHALYLTAVFVGVCVPTIEWRVLYSTYLSIVRPHYATSENIRKIVVVPVIRNTLFDFDAIERRFLSAGFVHLFRLKLLTF